MYVLSDMTECTILSFNNIRDQIKRELLTEESDIVIQLKGGHYFAKRTILRSLINLARTDKEEEKQFVFHNMSVIVPVIWPNLAEADKYNFGTVYAKISSTNKKDYVNNFYNEPLAAKLLVSMGTMIPDPAVYECLNAVIICITGNGYGVSENTQDYLQTILDRITTTKWCFQIIGLMNFCFIPQKMTKKLSEIWHLPNIDELMIYIKNSRMVRENQLLSCIMRLFIKSL